MQLYVPLCSHITTVSGSVLEPQPRVYTAAHRHHVDAAHQLSFAAEAFHLVLGLAEIAVQLTL